MMAGVRALAGVGWADEQAQHRVALGLALRLMRVERFDDALRVLERHRGEGGEAVSLSLPPRALASGGEGQGGGCFLFRGIAPHP